VQGGYGTCFCRPGTRLVEHYECRGTKLIASHIFIPCYKFNVLQWRGPDLSGFTLLFRKQERFAKTVTNLLILLSVLAKVVLINDLAELVLGAESIFYFIIR